MWREPARTLPVHPNNCGGHRSQQACEELLALQKHRFRGCPMNAGHLVDRHLADMHQRVLNSFATSASRQGLATVALFMELG